VRELSAALLRLVEYQAVIINKRLPKAVDLLDDLKGYGHIGLLEAQQRFDPKHGVNFETFATYRVRGAIFDGLRDCGLLGRRDYQRLRQEAMAHEVIGEPVGDGPDGPTRAGDAQVVYSSITRLATMHLLNHTINDTPNLETEMALKVDLNRLRLAMQRLTEADRALLAAVYDLKGSGDSSAELARRMGLSRSAVSRRHRRALDRLRRLLGEPPDR
jgi:RNA polymerase sigma factor for flagellar operon FliA